MSILFQNVKPAIAPRKDAEKAPEKPALATMTIDQQPDPEKKVYRVASTSGTVGLPILKTVEQSPRAAEQYRILRTNILQNAPNCSVIAVTSALPGDGKTVTTINLAAVFAMKTDAQILVIDADMRKYGLSAALGLNDTAGLADVLKQTQDLDRAIVRLDALPNLYVLPAGVPSVHPAELLDSAAFTTLVANLRKKFSYIFFDTTPTQLLADFKLVQKVCDGVILVVRPDHTGRAAFLKALEGENVDKLLGTVLNGVEDWLLWNTQESYGYYAPEAPKKRKWFFGRS